MPVVRLPESRGETPVGRGRVYGSKRRAVQVELLAAVRAQASSLRRQLEVLTQLAHHRPVDGEDVEAVRASLFAAHGWR